MTGTTREKKYSFLAKLTQTAESSEIYYFEMQNGIPKKLGDGSYGAVFAVESEKGGKFAVKLFYEIKDPILQKRFSQEKDVEQDILAKNLKPGNLVTAKYFTNSFRESPAWRTLEPYFRQLSLAVSNDALVMERYSCTLKSLLEHGRKDTDIEDRDPVLHRDGLPGYDTLRRTTSEKRESFVAWVAGQLVGGLRVLHGASLRHADLKPANILIRKLDTGALELGLSDFGNLQPNIAFNGLNASGGPVNHSDLSLGTLHYRSREQRDFFDICDVEVINEESNKPIRLIARDPKFRNSLMEKGDKVLFSKDKENHYHYEIINIDDKSHADSVSIYIDYSPSVASDPLTQIVIYKSQTIRTDVFGLGAIIYDILTCGKSPEDFYDYIRQWDKGVTNVQGNHIEKLLNEYKQVFNSQALRPEFFGIFDELRSPNGDYPSYQIVRILFKCLLTRSEGSYLYMKSRAQDSTRATNPNDVFDAIQRDLMDLNDSFRTKHNEGHYTRNEVWRGAELPGEKKKERTFIDDLTLVQRIQDARIRLREGCQLLFPVYDYLISCAHYGSKHDDEKHSIERTKQDKPFFADMSPRNLNYSDGDELSPRIAIYATESDYKKALIDDLARLRSSKLQNVFMPPFVTFMTRTVSIDESVPGETIDKARTVVSPLRATDSMPFWSGHTAKDYLIITKGMTTKNQALNEQHIIELRDSSATVSIEDVQPNTEILPTATLIRRLRPVEYYLAVLGIYIHQIFFVDNKHDSGSVPQILYFLEQKIAIQHDETIPLEYRQSMKSITESYINDTLLRRSQQQPAQAERPSVLKKIINRIHPSRDDELKDQSAVSYCYEWLAELYVWLVGCFFSRGRPGHEPLYYLTIVRDHIEHHLGPAIAETCGYANFAALRYKDPQVADIGQAKGEQIPSLSKLIYERFLRKAEK